MNSSRETELEKELQWVHDLMCNEKIQPREKIVLYRARYELRHSQRDENGEARIFVWRIANETGISTDGVGKSLQLLSEYGVIERRMAYVANDHGGTEKAIYVRLTDVARNPGDISIPDSGHGGKRVKRPHCPSCGHEEYVEHSKKICTSCGTVFDETWKTVEQTEEDTDA